MKNTSKKSNENIAVQSENYIKKHKRTSLGKEFGKRFIPILIAFLIPMTAFIYIIYLQIVASTNAAFASAVNGIVTISSSRDGSKMTQPDYERLTKLTMIRFGVNDFFYMDTNKNAGLMLTYNFSDFACSLYRANSNASDGNQGEYIEVDNGNSFMYLLERRSLNQEDYQQAASSTGNVQELVYSCSVEPYIEAWEFYKKHRHSLKKGIYSDIPTGFVSLNSYYINEETREFLPKSISLYTENVKREGSLFDYSESNEEELVKTLEYDYDESRLVGFEYVDCYATDFHENYYMK